MSAPLHITVKLTPKSARNAIAGWTVTDKDQPVLKVNVTAAPEKGKANQALITLLAKSWRIPKSSITIMRGASDRLKILSLDVHPAPQYLPPQDINEISS